MGKKSSLIQADLLWSRCTR